MKTRRIGLAVWFHHYKMARHLRKFGNVHYVSQRMRYAIVYVQENQLDYTIQKLKRMKDVKKVEQSRKHELKTEFKNPQRDQAKEYDYKLRM